ncbi:MAG: polysaccharide biosynthesis tyrosine autokinase [Terriglobia bacterium]|jgi:capsular exopolysaccharide synthesis family protein
MPENQGLAPRQANLLPAAHSPSAPAFDIEAQEFDSFSYLRTYWNIVSKHRWTIISIALIVTLLVAIVSFKMTPIYEATVRLDIEADTLQIQSLNDFFRQIPTDEAFIGTQIQVLEGVSLAERTIEQVGVVKDPRWVAAIQPSSGPFSSKLPISADEIVGPFTRSLHVQKVRDSHVVDVSFESADPNLSAKIANSLADNYIEYNIRQKYDATLQASGWMEGQLDELKAKVEKSQQALVDYERQNAIVNISNKESVVEQRMDDLSRDLTNAQTDRLQKESIYEVVRSNESEVAFVAQNDLLQHLEEKYADLKSQYVDTLQQSGPKHPKAERLQSQVDEIQSLIERERKRMVERIKNEYMAALGRESLLAAAVAKEKVEVGALNQLLIQHNLLKRESDTNQQLYDNLLQRLKEATVSAGLRATNIHVVDPARPPKSPIRPQKLHNILVGLMVGLVLGLALAFAKEAVDTSIQSIDEAERLANAPALAVVPLDRALRRLTPSLSGNNGKLAAMQGLALLSRPSSAIAESFRGLVTSVVLSTAPQPPQTLLITSSTAREGKSITALNLAIALAQRGEPTLLIDADMRNPRIAESLTLVNGPGLASILTGAHDIESALQQFPPVPMLWALPSGPKPPDPAHLLSSSAMDSMLQELRKRFKFVVIDSPPVLPVTDAMILSTLVDGVIFIVESGATVRGAVTRARKILQNVGTTVLGVVLNKVDVRNNGYCGDYTHYYNNHYFGDSKRTGKPEVAGSPPPS